MGTGETGLVGLAQSLAALEISTEHVCAITQSHQEVAPIVRDRPLKPDSLNVRFLLVLLNATELLMQ